MARMARLQQQLADAQQLAATRGRDLLERERELFECRRQLDACQAQRADLEKQLAQARRSSDGSEPHLSAAGGSGKQWGVQALGKKCLRSLQLPACPCMSGGTAYEVAWRQCAAVESGRGSGAAPEKLMHCPTPALPAGARDMSSG